MSNVTTNAAVIIELDNGEFDNGEFDKLLLGPVLDSNSGVTSPSTLGTDSSPTRISLSEMAAIILSHLRTILFTRFINRGLR